MHPVLKRTNDAVDRAVLKCAQRLHDDRRSLTRLHPSRPEKFARVISKTIVVYPEIRQDLSRWIAFYNFSTEKRDAIVSRSLRRLVRRGDLRRERITVPVMIEAKKSPKIVNRPLTCYWPSTVLDRLADC